MKSGYLIVDTKINDPIAYEEYKKLAKPIVERFGGEYMARGGALYIDQSDLWTPTRLVVIKFDSVEKVKSFLSCKEYQLVKSIRLDAARSTAVILEGT